MNSNIGSSLFLKEKIFSFIALIANGHLKLEITNIFYVYFLRYNPEILMKTDERPRRGGYDSPPRRASPRRDRGRSPSPRHFPSQERNFAQSMREERRVTGGYDRGPDAYEMNNYSKQYDNEDDYGRYGGGGRGEPRRMRGLEQNLGYYPWDSKQR